MSSVKVQLFYQEVGENTDSDGLPGDACDGGDGSDSDDNPTIEAGALSRVERSIDKFFIQVVEVHITATYEQGRVYQKVLIDT